ncbi:UDP-glucose:Glycoprotein Glucosyltransferase [Anaeramoeba flamelloides]|uniref:UDP-glucose:Glycoprotein Glucosyltransferase n=1 Tax=Anaeramoeba flamelloides TaxID=1746091 RepID=A0ABQ8XMS4_9EUKA|nr:UDP-glucose:Glycoprotein Glucosyltransferase [Anaeramoeba flamelloides]
MRNYQFLFLFLFLLFSTHSNCNTQHNAIFAGVESNFPRSNLISESIEFLYSVLPTKFWAILESYSQMTSGKNMTEQEIYHDFRSLVELNSKSNFLSNLYDWTLSTHQYSVSVESQRILSNQEIFDKGDETTKKINCDGLHKGNWIEFRGKCFCDLEKLTALSKKNGNDNKQLDDYFSSILKEKQENVNVNENEILQEEKKEQDKKVKTKAGNNYRTNQYTFDKIYPTGNIDPKTELETLVFYGRVNSPSFYDWTTLLKRLSELKKYKIFFRQNPEIVSNNFNLPGWGIELIPKQFSNNYTFDNFEKQHPNSFELIKNHEVLYKTEINSIRDNLIQLDLIKPKNNLGLSVMGIQDQESVTENENENESENESESEEEEDDDDDNDLEFDNDNDGEQIGMKISQLILESKNPLQTMNFLIENNLIVKDRLKNIQINKDISEKISTNQKNYFNFENLLSINGRILDFEDFEPFEIHNLLSKEYKRISRIQKMIPIIDYKTASELSKLPSMDYQNLRIDILNSKGSKKNIIFLNNLEKDEKYSDWELKSISDLDLSKNQIPQISKNIFTIIYILDLSSMESLETLAKVYTNYQNGAPIRYGFIFYGKEPRKKVSELVINFFFHFLEIEGIDKAISFLQTLNEIGKQDNSFRIENKHIQKSFNIHNPKSINKYSEYKNKYQERVDGMKEFITKKQLNLNFGVMLNGKYLENHDNVEKILFGELLEEYLLIREMIRNKDLIDGKDAYKQILNKFYVVKKWDQDLYKRKPQYISERIIGNNYNNIQYLEHPSFDKNENLTEQINGKQIEAIEVTHWIIIDLLQHNETQLINCISDLNKNLQDGKLKHRVGIIHNPKKITDSYEDKYLIVSKKILKIDLDRSIFKLNKKFISTRIGLKPSKIYMITNGRILQIQKLSDLNYKYLNQVGNFEYHTKNKLITDILKETNYNYPSIPIVKRFEYLFKIAAMVGNEKNKNIYINSINNLFLIQEKELHSKQTGFIIHSNSIRNGSVINQDIANNNKDFLFEFLLILNPLSKNVQKIMYPLSQIIQSFDSIRIKILLNPQFNELKFSSNYQYFRMAFDTQINFNKNGKLIDKNNEICLPHPFSGKSFEIHEITMDSWLIDKIQINDLLKNCDSNYKFQSISYKLSNIITSGRLLLQIPGQVIYPQDLEIELTKPYDINSDAHIIDHTFAMSANGYFQLKSNPGIYQFAFPEKIISSSYQFVGESEKIFSVSSFKGIDVDILIKFIGNPQHNLEKKRNKELKKYVIQNKISKTINIFLVISNKLEEKISKVMILSVLKNTNSQIKFWFLQDGLSPGFLTEIDKLSQEYHFEYETVIYKWPTWLDVPKYKNRIINGIKILFLDVLFPPHVNKLLILKPNQLIKTDIKELFNLDMKDSIFAMNKYEKYDEQIKNFFQNNEFQHNSIFNPNLILVNLQRVRQLRIGDKYRFLFNKYENSDERFVNIDEGILNFAQNLVPITPLAFKWICCKNYCDDEQLKASKIIDICEFDFSLDNVASKIEKAYPNWVKLNNEIIYFEKNYQNNSDNDNDKDDEYKMNQDQLLGLNKLVD